MNNGASVIFGTLACMKHQKRVYRERKNFPVEFEGDLHPHAIFQAYQYKFKNAVMSGSGRPFSLAHRTFLSPPNQYGLCRFHQIMQAS